jgi:hypothetical protein
MRSRILKVDGDLETFAAKFKQRGNDVSLAYLRQSRVRAFLNVQGEMIAGYAFNTVRPLRYEGWISEQNRETIAVFASKKKLCELTCIWISKREGKISSELIYLYAVIDALLTGATYILGGTLSSVVFGIQTQSLPRILYFGITDYFGKSQKCWVYCATRREVLTKIVSSFAYSIFMGLLGKNVYLGKARVRARCAESYEFL